MQFVTPSELKRSLNVVAEDFSKTVKDNLGSFKADAMADIKNLRLQVDQLRAQLGRPDAGGSGDGGVMFGNYQTPGRKMIEQKDLFEQFKRTNNVKFDIGGFFPMFEEKTLIDSAALGFSTPGILSAERIESIVPLQRRRLTVRDLLRSRSISTGQIDWIKELAFGNAASPQVEGSDKGESSNTFTIASSRVSTIAHWIPLTKQALDDLPELRRFVDENLTYGLKLKEEVEILNGDGTGVHLSGLTTQSTPYAGTYAAAGDTKLDTLRHAILELENADDECTGFILNPIDMHAIDLIKTEEGGANKGMYVVGDPLGGSLRVRTLWNRPVVVSRSMAAGKFLAGNFAQAVIGDRMDAIIDVSEAHLDYFTKNKIAIRAEERIALAVLRPTSFRYGNI